MKSFNLEILTPGRRVFAGPVQSLILPGSEGYFGVLADHAPILAQLAEGVIILKQGDSQRQLRCGPGMADVTRETVAVLVDSAEDDRAQSA